MSVSKTTRFGVFLLLGWNCATGILAVNPTKLNGPLVAGGSVSSAFFDAAGTDVLYVADQDTNDLTELYSVPSGGGEPVKLNAPLVAGGELSYFVFPSDPAAGRLLYLAAQEIPLVYEIYSVPITGGTPTKLNNPLPLGGDVSTMWISPDGMHALYRADQEADEVFEIYSIPMTGGTPVKLNGPLVGAGDVLTSGLKFSPDSSRVLYLADQIVDERIDLFSVPITGGPPTKINGTLPLNGDVSATGLQFNPDGSQVLYVADQDVDNVFELYVAPSTGGTPIKLNSTLVGGGDVYTNGLRFSPDGSHVLYVADQQTDGVDEIFSVPSAGGTPVKLNGTLPVGGDVKSSSLHFTPDGVRVVYLADQQTDNVEELYSVPATGGTPTKLNGTLVGGGDVFAALTSPDSSRVAYTADQDTDNVEELYSVPTAGGTSVKLNAPLPGGGQVLSYSVQFSPDGSRVLYTADPIGSTLPETFIVPSAGGTPIKLSARVAVGSAEGKWPLLSPDGNRVIYRADPDMDGAYDLYSHIVGQRWIGSSAAWGSVVNWNHGALPDEAMLIVIDEPVVVTLPAALEEATVNELRLGGGAGTSTLLLESGVTLAAINGITILSGGAIRGEGNIQAEVVVAPGGMVAPGNSEGLLEVDALTMNVDSLLDIEIAGTSAGINYDQLLVGDGATLGGFLTVALNSFIPGSGDSFTILASSALAGSFSNAANGARLDTLGGEGSFQVNYDALTNNVVLSDFMASLGLTGDYNGNGKIDAADYAVWRDAMTAGATELLNDPTPDTVDESDFAYWREHFGQSLGSGAAAGLSSVAVPEPTALPLALSGWVYLLYWGCLLRRQTH